MPSREIPPATPPLGDDEQARALGLALKALRTRAKFSQPDAAENFGVTSGEAWRKYEAGLAPTIHRPDVQTRLAAAVSATRDDLLREAGFSAQVIPIPRPKSSTPRFDMLPMRDRVQAGAWLQADDSGQGEPELVAVLRDARYPHADQWVSEVVGDSMNILGITHGDIVHLVEAGAVRSLKTGDVVEVERLRFGGGERELTLKEVEVLENGLRLWPRSTNPRWQEALSILDGTESDEEIEVRVRGLVLSVTRRFT